MTDKNNPTENHRFYPDESNKPQEHKSMGDSRHQRERFELLSAYLDGEVTASERQQVQLWLDTDPKFQLVYRRMLQLRTGIQKIPLPPPSQSAQQLSAAVFQKIDNRQRQRKVLVWSGGAIAALFLGAVSTILPKMGINPMNPQFAQNNQNSEPLMVALNRPTVKIPPKSADLFPHIAPRPIR